MGLYKLALWLLPSAALASPSRLAFSLASWGLDGVSEASGYPPLASPLRLLSSTAALCISRFSASLNSASYRANLFSSSSSAPCITAFTSRSLVGLHWLCTMVCPLVASPSSPRAASHPLLTSSSASPPSNNRPSAARWSIASCSAWTHALSAASARLSSRSFSSASLICFGS